MKLAEATKDRIKLSLPIVASMIYGFAIWSAALNVQFSGDDYQYLHSLAPIRSFGDLIKPFFMADINASIFRPLANMTFVSDFLIFGWHSWGFHLTNLLLHTISIALVYLTSRRIFHLERRIAFGAAFVFGILGSHDFNILTSTARADILVAIFTMSTLLLERKTDRTRSRTRFTLYRVLGLASFVLALFSKEVAVMIVPMLVLLFDVTPWSFNRESIVKSVKRVWPYCMVLVAWYFYHAHFTMAASASQPLQADAVSSPAALLRNILYGVGYMFLPLDLQTATTLLTQYKIPAIIAGILVLSGTSWVLLKSLKAENLRAFYAPLVFAMLSGFLVLISFERWRLYTPSIGGVALVVILIGFIAVQYPKRMIANMRRALVYGYLIFNSIHAVLMCMNWGESTALLSRYKDQLGKLLTPIAVANESVRGPVLDVTFIDVPSKLGSASVLQLGLEDIAKQAIAERRYPKDAALCDVSKVKLVTHTATEVYAYDRDRGFDDLQVSRPNHGSFELRTGSIVDDAARTSMTLIPALGFVAGVARRDWVLKSGANVQLERANVLIEKANGPTASQLLVRMTDTTSIPILFENNEFSIAK
jgi:hypothetical protein